MLHLFKRLRVCGLVVIALVIAMSFTSACALKAPPPEVKELPLGSNVALTGGASAWGIPGTRALEMEIEKINAEGGIEIGGDTYIIKYYKEDNEWRTDLAALKAHKLIEEHNVRAMFGALCSHDTMALLPVCYAAKVPNFATCWENDPLLKENNGDYCFKTLLSPHEGQPAIYNYIFAANPEATRVAEFTSNTMSSLYGTELSKRYLKSIGKEVVFEEYYEVGVTDFYPYLTRLLATHPDVLHCAASPSNELALIMKQSREMGFEGPIMKEIGLTPDMVDIAGVEGAEGRISVETPWFGELSTPEWRDFHDRFVERYGEWDPFAPYWTPALFALLEAYQEAGTIDDPDAVVEVLSGKTFYSYGLETRFGDGGGHYDFPHVMAYPYYIMEFRNGENVPVGVIDVASQIDLAW